MSSLYQLSEDLELLLNDEESTEEEIEEQLQNLCKNLNKKGDSIAMFIKSLKAQEEALTNEINNLTHRKRITGNKINGLKKYVLDNMEMMNLQEVGDLHKLKKCKNGGKLPLIFGFNKDDITEVEKKVDKEYIEYIPTIDNNSIRNDLDNGKKLNFVEYGERGYHVRIK